MLALKKFFAVALLQAVLILMVSIVSVKAQSTSSSDQRSHSLKLNFANKSRPQNARSIIDCEDGAWFDDASNTIEFSGKVVVTDPQFTLTCDQLNVVMNDNRQGLKKATAKGNVVIHQENVNDHGEVIKSIGKGGEAIYEPGTGDVTLKYWPQIQQGVSYQVATEEATIMILNNKGTSRTIGQSRSMIVDQDKADQEK
jgi:lipopolysaccharide transport protein LptA